MAAATDAPKKVLGRYTLLDRIGAGGTAEIYRAKATGPAGFEKIVVVKRLLPELASRASGDGNRSFLDLLVAEAKVTAALQHANIVSVYELGEASDGYYIVMEHVDGIDLLQLLEQCHAAEQRIPPELVLYVASELCKALSYAHSATGTDGAPLGIVHRDVTPANVMLSRHGDVKLTDFGVARVGPPPTDDDGPSQVRGKLAYMSPEQLDGGPVDHRTDLFALGILMYEALTMTRLFAGKTPGQTVANVRKAAIDKRLARYSDRIPAGVVPILQRALARDPDDRYPHADELQEDILDYLFEERLRVSKRRLRRFVSEITGTDDVPTQVPTTRPPTRRKNLPNPSLQDSVFRLRNDGGSPFGPITWDNLVNLLRSSAISPREKVSVDGGPWLSVQEVTGIRNAESLLFGAGDGPARFEGQLSRYEMPRLLMRLAAQRVTGKVAFVRSTVLKQLWLQDGAPVHVSSNLKEELLGPYVVANGGVAEADLMRAASRARKQGGFLGESLVALGVLPPHELFRLLEGQLRSKLRELFRWRDGWFAFFDGVRPPAGMPHMRHATPSLVTEGVRLHFDARDLWTWHRERLDHVVRLARAPRIDLHALKLDGPESRFARALRNGYSVRTHIELLANDKAGRVVLARVIFLLERGGLLALEAPRT